MSTFQLDNSKIPFEPGDTIIRAAHRAGIEVPHYCWHPGLSVAANCRMCLVELLPAPGRKAMTLDVLRWDAETQQYVKEQKPKLVPACQQPVSEGMQVRSESSDHVARARAAVQEMLLLNHPVDCPICDQAGECRLQDYWLSQGSTPKRMRDEPIHKPKAVVFGPHIVYDAERCIVCTRCVRVCEELAQDPVLSVSQRGNLNEITVAPGRQLDHNYSLMTEVVCPVGALTSREFRFKARVWFLRSVRSVCVGCATGCNSYTDYDPRQSRVYRYRPRENPAVNKHWMCDSGMLDYSRIHEGRILEPRLAGEPVPRRTALEKAADLLRNVPAGKLAIFLGAEFSQEDNSALLALGRELKCTQYFESGRSPGASDNILMHADKNPNSAGVRKLLGTDLQPVELLMSGLNSGHLTHVLALGASLKDSQHTEQWGQLAGHVRIILASHEGPLIAGANVVLPVCTWAETEATYVNAKGMAQVTEQAILPQGLSLPGWKWVSHLAQALGLKTKLNSADDARAAIERQRAPSSTSNAAQTESQP
jgi:NADH-quinone oxidoreductase subunit G